MKEVRYRKIPEILFYVAIMIELLIVILEKSAYIIQYEGYWFRLTFGLFAIKAVCNKYTAKQWIGLVLVGITSVISYKVTGRNEMIRILALVAACKDVEAGKLLKTIFWTTLIGCLTVVLLSFVGIGGSIAVTEEFRVGRIETRYCFGLGHPNSFHGMVWVLVTLGGYLYRRKLKLWHYGLMFAFNIAIYMFTLSRTAVLLTAMVIMVYVVLSCHKKFNIYKWFYVVCAVGVIACVVVTIVLCEAWWTSTLVRAIDRKLSMRIQVVNMGPFNASPSEWTLFAMAKNTYYFDMGIARLFYWYGIVPGALYIFMNLHLVYIAYKKKDSFLAALVVLSIVYTTIEAHLISEYMLRNYLLILYGLALTVPREEKMKRQEYYLWDIGHNRRGLKRE